MSDTEKHERESRRHLHLGLAHGELGEIQDQIERLRHRAEMLETFIASGGEGEPPEPEGALRARAGEGGFITK
jgi:hypothetical protein